MAYLQPDKEGKVYLPAIRAAKQRAERLVCLTAYDYPTARIVDEAGVDIILVGDSIGNVIHGYGNTIPVSIEEILAACIAVKRGTERAMVVCDMPFGTYHISENESVRNASADEIRGAEAVKLEGGRSRAGLVKRLVDEEIPVVAHIGLTPQSVYKMGGYRVQGRTSEQAKRLIEDAKLLEEAGAFAIVLELVPRELAAIISKELKISTIGIGAGRECDIQVLVLHDLMGMTFGRQPRFVRQYANLRSVMTDAIQAWSQDVKSGAYPNDDESYGLTEETKREMAAVDTNFVEIINRRQRIFSIARKLRREEKTVGFVPTMGSLHDGHLALIREARQRCDIVIVSIFVNPKQFNNSVDLENYPRDLTADAALLAENGADYVFAPDENEIYPAGFSTHVSVRDIADRFEGESRPGHFRGVATVVTILFNTVRPDYAFFGQKDAQQVAVIKRLTADLGFEMEIIVVPTIREQSGLAMSSRNVRLSADEREKAIVIIESLRQAKIAFKRGERNAAALIEIVETGIAYEPLARIDYVAVVDRNTLRSLDKVEDNEALIIIAVVFGEVRLIDNVILNRKQ